MGSSVGAQGLRQRAIADGVSDRHMHGARRAWQRKLTHRRLRGRMRTTLRCKPLQQTLSASESLHSRFRSDAGSWLFQRPFRQPAAQGQTHFAGHCEPQFPGGGLNDDLLALGQGAVRMPLCRIRGREFVRQQSMLGINLTQHDRGTHSSVSTRRTQHFSGPTTATRQ